MYLWQITKLHIHLIHEPHGKHYVIDRATGQEINGQLRPVGDAFIKKCLTRVDSKGLYTSDKLKEWQAQRSRNNPKLNKKWKRVTSMHYELEETTGKDIAGTASVVTVTVRLKNGLFSQITIKGGGMYKEVLLLEPIEKALTTAEGLLKAELLTMIQVLEAKLGAL